MSMSSENDKDPKAVALQYRPHKDNAPRVTAKGTGVTAEKIIALARQHHVPLRNDPDLVEVLSMLDLEAEIPPGIYVVVAELLAYIYRLNEDNKEP
ncbi:MAG: EscU/YscU/HrcU family type III secretion system export apparatus switch protein [Thermodesulfobacteriota bacterium]|nr:EscU/YscU/HrcU family type III secretion system export apparatus switch protein [Thermodesulfobacteriota bacterium]